MAVLYTKFAVPVQLVLFSTKTKSQFWSPSLVFSRRCYTSHGIMSMSTMDDKTKCWSMHVYIPCTVIPLCILPHGNEHNGKCAIYVH